RPESDCDADDAKAGDRRPDLEVEDPEDLDTADDDDEGLEDVRPERVERVHPLADLDRAELLGGSLGRLAVHEGLDDPVDEDARRTDRDDGDEEDEQDGSERLAEEREEL